MSKKKKYFKRNFRTKYLKIKGQYSRLEYNIEKKQTNDEIFYKNQNKDLMHIALEVWKIQKKVKKMKENIGEESIKWFEYPIEKLFEILEKNKIKIIDYTGKKYLEWMNWFDIVSVEKNEAIIEPIFLDTVSPIIEENGLVVQRWKVVILSN